MLSSRSLPALPLLALLLLLTAGTRAAAQVEAPTPLEEVDPDARGAEPAAPAQEPAAAEAPEAQEATAQPAPPAPRAEAPAVAEAAPEPAPTAQSAAAPPAAGLPPVLAPRVDDGQLVAAWGRVHQAQAGQDPAALETALRALVSLREDVGATDLDPFGIALARLAQVRRQAADEPGALQLAEAAVALAPHLPYTHFALARTYALQDPLDVRRYATQVAAALDALVGDPRYLRPALADVGGAALLALLATASLVLLLLFARGVRYFLHDVHHLFPRSTARWQSAALALLLVGLPAVFRLGWAPLLLALFAAVVIHLGPSERALGAVLIALLGLLPLAGGQLARETAFAGTAAEDVYLLERGGLSAAAAGARVRARDEAQRASFAELFALGRYQARRGDLAGATALYKRAATLRSPEARLITNLGNVRLASGDEEGAAQLYLSASQVDPALAAPYFNLAQVYRREAKTKSELQVAGPLGRASTALTTAQRLEPSLLGREPPPDGRLLMNRLLLSPGVPPSELQQLQAPDAGAAVEAQLERLVLGGWGGPLAWALPGALAFVLLAWGYSRDRLQASRGCERCGRSVCRRCDRELPRRSAHCGQCVNAFERKGRVAPPVRARKQLEVARHRTRMGHLALSAGALVGGAGHLLSGLPVRGALHAFGFLLLLLGVLGPQGLVRAPYGELEWGVKLALLLALLLPLHLLSLRALYRRQQQQAAAAEETF